MSVSSYQSSIADRNGVVPVRSTPVFTRDSSAEAPATEAERSDSGSGVRVSLSPSAVNGMARARAAQEAPASDRPKSSTNDRAGREGESKSGVSESTRKPQERAQPSRPEAAPTKRKSVSDGLDLTPEEKRVVSQLQSRDAEVRAHEQAHIAASGGLAGGASYSYQEGPDGRRYAVGGEVGISMSTGSTPDETIRNAQQVRSAALAPAQPSGQDRAVAAAASQMEAQALRGTRRAQSCRGRKGSERRKSG